MKVLLFFLFVAGPFCVRAQLRPAPPLVPGLVVPGWGIGGDSLFKGEPLFKGGLLPGGDLLFKGDLPGRRELLFEGNLPGGRGLLSGGDSSLRGRLLVSQQRSRVVILRPDGMPCVAPNLLLVERMPVDRRGNADRMRRDLKPY